MCCSANKHADLLNCGGELQAQLNDLVLGGGEVTDPCQRCPASRQREERENIRSQPWRSGSQLNDELPHRQVIKYPTLLATAQELRGVRIFCSAHGECKPPPTWRRKRNHSIFPFSYIFRLLNWTITCCSEVIEEEQYSDNGRHSEEETCGIC